MSTFNHVESLEMQTCTRDTYESPYYIMILHTYSRKTKITIERKEQCLRYLPKIRVDSIGMGLFQLIIEAVGIGGLTIQDSNVAIQSLTVARDTAEEIESLLYSLNYRFIV